MFLFCSIKNEVNYTRNHQDQISLSIIDKFIYVFYYYKRGISRCTRRKASLTVEAAAVMPFFACFLVFIMFFFRVLQVQSQVAQALQYSGRKLAAECCSTSDSGTGTVGTMAKLQIYFRRELSEQNCPFKYIRHGSLGVSLAQSELSGEYVDIKAVYQLQLPVSLLGNIHYQIVQESKSRKWTGYKPEQDNADQDNGWLYYTPYGTVYHASRSCAYLDLSIQGLPYRQVSQNRNSSGGRYYPCEACGGNARGGMVYITTYGDRYHSSLTCSSLKRTVYMIRRSEAKGKGMCSKCGGGS